MLSNRRGVRMNVTIQIAIQRIGSTFHTFQLKSRVRNIIAMVKQLVDLMLNISPRTDVKVIRENVSRHSEQTLCKAPHMDIVNAKYTIYPSNIFDHGLHVHIARRAFEQNIDGILQNPPGIIKNQKTDQHTDKWVEPIGLREINEDTCNHRPNRGNHISHQMDKGRAQVEVMFTAALDKQSSHKIDNHCDKTHADQNTRLDLGRIYETLIGFKEYTQGNHHQRC